MPSARQDSMLAATISYLQRDQLSDAELLARFLDGRDETAFEALLLRHTAAVRSVCRSWLRGAADIDDATQATFLVLVQRAGSIRNRESLGGWLFGVAANVARRLHQQQRKHDPLPNELPGPDNYDIDVRELVNSEIARLPEKYRLPIQLCYAAGLTTAEAAQRLGIPKGTLLTRLAWARRRLQRRLTNRGVAPGLLAGLLIGQAVPNVNAAWLHATVRIAQTMVAGETLAGAGSSARSIALSQGVVRAMMWKKLQYVVLGVLLTVGLAGLGVHQWVVASDGPGTNHKAFVEVPDGKESAKIDETRQRQTQRRREAVIRSPSGTFVKEVDVAPYGSGRLTWTYEDERVVGLIEASVLGGEVELATEAEYALSSNGTIYGLITSVRFNHLKLPTGDGYAELQPYVGLLPVVEPLVNETLSDLPFSYRFRVQDDRLIISNYRVLLAGPNPLGKLGAFAAGEELYAMLGYFQAIGTAIEGTYTAADPNDPPAGQKRPLFMKSRGKIDIKKKK